MIRRSLELTQEQWQRLDELAALTESHAPTGENAGQPSWRTLIKNIANGDIKELPKMNDWKVSFYYGNPKRNHKTLCETREEAEQESLERLEVVSYIENTRTDEWAKREANSSDFDWFPKK